MSPRDPLLCLVMAGSAGSQHVFSKKNTTEHDSVCGGCRTEESSFCCCSLYFLRGNCVACVDPTAMTFNVSLNSFNTFHRCHPFRTCHILTVFHCLSFIIHMAPLMSQKLLICIEVTSVTGLPPLPWSSPTRDWVDEGWPCDTWGMSRESRGISCC